VTLLSNNDRDCFETNTSTEFINHFSPPIQLKPYMYEIGLVQIGLTGPTIQQQGRVGWVNARACPFHSRSDAFIEHAPPCNALIKRGVGFTCAQHVSLSAHCFAGLCRLSTFVFLSILLAMAGCLSMFPNAFRAWIQYFSVRPFTEASLVGSDKFRVIVGLCSIGGINRRVLVAVSIITIMSFALLGSFRSKPPTT
jgi:hypothetical protein